ncbi:MAG TPA: CYTH domain-containing protein [Rhizobiaceae bacterium]|nr:CYTH domain-containing protein [Rhizobiaceae bacterium]
MAKEVERKFLVASDAWRGASASVSRIEQFYLALAEGRSVRIRIKDGMRAVITLKFGRNAKVRDEFEFPVPVEDACEMRAFAIGHIIDKTRHLVPHGGHVFEVDQFHGDLDGLVLAELETTDDILDTALPSWLGREVTGENDYYNAVLATLGRPAERK